MEPRTSNSRGRPLDDATLESLGLRYVGRFATTEARLTQYLLRKVRERGWSSSQEPEAYRTVIADIVRRYAERHYVDDRAFAGAKARALETRGFGSRHIVQVLRGAGIDAEIIDDLVHDEHAAFSAAERFARRKRIGPFGEANTDPRVAARQHAAMVRAGHSHVLARYFVAMPPEDVTLLDTPSK